MYRPHLEELSQSVRLLQGEWIPENRDNLNEEWQDDLVEQSGEELLIMRCSSSQCVEMCQCWIEQWMPTHQLTSNMI